VNSFATFREKNCNNAKEIIRGMGEDDLCKKNSKSKPLDTVPLSWNFKMPGKYMQRDGF
jgi:hypothetical protein